MFMPSLKVSNDVTSRVITLTPKLAQEFLSNNKHNRPINWRHVSKLAEAIKNDEWRLNGEAIVMSSTGKLIQGQHRCLAVTKAMKDIKILLVENVPDDTFHTFDSGRKRTSSDVFAISGEKNCNVTAGAARLIYLYKQTGRLQSNANYAPSSTQLFEVLNEFQILRDAASFVSCSKWIKKYLQPSCAAFCYAIFFTDNQVTAKEFFAKLESGEELTSGSPILLLRSRLFDEYGGNKKLSPEYKAALAFKAYKHFKSGTKLRTLRVTFNDKFEDDVFKL